MPYHMTNYVTSAVDLQIRVKNNRYRRINTSLPEAPAGIGSDFNVGEMGLILEAKPRRILKDSNWDSDIVTSSSFDQIKITRKQRLTNNLNVRTNCLCAWPVYTSKNIIHIPFHDTNGPWPVHSRCR